MAIVRVPLALLPPLVLELHAVVVSANATASVKALARLRVQRLTMRHSFVLDLTVCRLLDGEGCGLPGFGQRRDGSGPPGTRRPAIDARTVRGLARPRKRCVPMGETVPLAEDAHSTRHRCRGSWHWRRAK